MAMERLIGTWASARCKEVSALGNVRFGRFHCIDGLPYNNGAVARDVIKILNDPMDLPIFFRHQFREVTIKV